MILLENPFCLTSHFHLPFSSVISSNFQCFLKTTSPVPYMFRVPCNLAFEWICCPIILPINLFAQSHIYILPLISSLLPRPVNSIPGLGHPFLSYTTAKRFEVSSCRKQPSEKWSIILATTTTQNKRNKENKQTKNIIKDPYYPFPTYNHPCQTKIKTCPENVHPFSSFHPGGSTDLVTQVAHESNRLRCKVQSILEQLRG